MVIILIKMTIMTAMRMMLKVKIRARKAIGTEMMTQIMKTPDAHINK